ncbi:VWA domain-containing protein [Ruegeria sp.]|uniref:VWA domain-containing protein n=1 Tax=Ruegeria sp. TaxID=1879320 RepID=UPI00231306AA|nr:VWA domain-containing protein [Ruegeria sp.]MDA7963977.1 VWA domain-containing protein [Ruegeria sp.]
MELILPELALFTKAFHFLRPLWLLLLIPLLALWWVNRRAATRVQPMSDRIAPHLQKALTVGDEGRRWYLPIDHATLILTLAILGASGPSWTRQVDPFLAKTGPLVIVLEVTSSMTSPDLPPDRLERAKFKIRDLLDLRAGGRTALVAYAGTAHRVLPFTEDPQVMLPYLEGLQPEVMPDDGANALAALDLATNLLEAEQAGGILFVLDGLDTGDAREINATQDTAIAALAMLPEGVGDQGLDLLTSVPVIRATPNDADVARLDRLLNTDYRRAMLENSEQPWEDRGWWLAIPAVLLALIWFRQGWTMRWSAALIAMMAVMGTPQTADADGIADWFLTPDQQGYRAYQNKDFQVAADAFVDPPWKGHALYRAGRYDEAIEVLGRLDSPEASFTQGLAHIKNRQYRDGVRAFEITLQRDPDFPGAAQNLQTAQEIVEYVEATREASDTGEEAGIGADDVVFDNEAARGAETLIEQQPTGEAPILSTEQWMNTVDTSTGDFLRMRFQFEANAGQ